MEGIWKVYYDNEVVGTCSVEQKGLYFCFLCHCMKVTTEICRLVVQCAGQIFDLGVMIPENGLLYISRNIPAKKLPKGQPMFCVRTEKQTDDGNFIPVREGEAFFHLSQLDKARFAGRNGKVGVIVS